MAFLTDDDDAFEAVLSFVDDFAADESLPDDGVVDSLETEEQLRGDELEMPTIEDMHLQVDGDAATCIEADAAPGLRRSLRLSQRTSGCSNVSADTTLPGSLRSIRRVAIKAKKKMHTAQASPTTDCRVLRVDSEGLLQYLDDAYSQMREGVNGMYLEVFSNKVLPFGLHATAEATWNYFKGSKKHRGTLYAKEAQDLDTLYTVIEHFSKELVAGNSSTDVRIKQIVRRSPSLVSHGMLDTQTGTIYDPKYIKVAKSLENLLLKRAQQQIADCSSSIQKPGAICPPGRTLDFRADAADFQELLDSAES
ncbi:hypothetical protein PC120_g11533 [Phytophthora cactorum]|nr:hypothetical protein PC120_g11533 [Phytophthora cactorum]